MGKEDVVCVCVYVCIRYCIATHNGVLLSHQKESNNAICKIIDGSRGYYTKRSKSERERQIPYDITYRWNLKYDTNQHIYETKTDA